MQVHVGGLAWVREISRKCSDTVHRFRVITS